jgi:hypothetical protein
VFFSFSIATKDKGRMFETNRYEQRYEIDMRNWKREKIKEKKLTGLKLHEDFLGQERRNVQAGQSWVIRQQRTKTYRYKRTVQTQKRGLSHASGDGNH